MMKYSPVDGHAIGVNSNEFDEAVEEIASEQAAKLIDIPLMALVYYELLYRKLYGKRE